LRHGFLGYDEGGHTSTPANRSGDIFAPVEMEVCAGAHRLVVMKEGTSRLSPGFPQSRQPFQLRVPLEEPTQKAA
jgi:hypothetical protein